MAVFTVLESSESDVDRTILVPDGFSIAAAVLTVVWALWHRLWIVAAVLFLFLAVIGVIMVQFGVNDLIVALVQSATGLLFGFEAQRLRVMSLERAGYRNAGLIGASNYETAELAHFMRKSSLTGPAERKPKLGSDSHDTLGLFGTT